MLGIYEREGWAKAELELEGQRREGEAAERRWLEELGVAQGRPPPSLLEELGVARVQAPPPSSTQVQSPGLLIPGVTILQQVMGTGMFDPFQVMCSVQ